MDYQSRDIVFPQGATYSWSESITTDGAPVDLTGWSAVFQVLDSSGNVLIEIVNDAGISMGADGNLACSLSWRHSAGLTVNERYLYDLLLYREGDDVRYRPRSGVFMVTPAVSQTGGPTPTPPNGATDQQLLEWAMEGGYQIIGSPTRDPDQTISSATIQWADDSAGVYTRTAKDATFGLVNGYTLSHANSGKTVVQDAFTRDANGNPVGVTDLRVTTS